MSKYGRFYTHEVKKKEKPHILSTETWTLENSARLTVSDNQEKVMELLKK